MKLLLEHRRAGRTQARLLPAQAGGDGARIGDFAGAEPVDVGRTGAALLGSALLREGRISGEQNKQNTERGSPRGAAPYRCRFLF
jgi:hypothetical protein